MPPKKVRGRSVERLARVKWIGDYVSGCTRPVSVYDLQGTVAARWDVSARQVRDDLMILRRPAARDTFVFWKRAGHQYVWTHARRYAAAVRPADGSLEAYR
mgnify:CR=1 FL=1